MEFADRQKGGDRMNGTIEAMARAIIDKVYPVNVIVEFSLETDPNTVIGCGTQWERFAAGRALIGRSDTYAVGWEGGEAEHRLTVNEIASHEHDYTKTGAEIYAPANAGTGCNLSDAAYGEGGKSMWGLGTKTTAAGGGQPHNNMQPSRAVDRWVRVA